MLFIRVLLPFIAFGGISGLGIVGAFWLCRLTERYRPTDIVY